MSLKFTCPKCKAHRIEIIENVTSITSEIKELDEDGDSELEFIQAHDSEVDRIQCLNCGYIIPGIIDMFELADWIKENCSQE